MLNKITTLAAISSFYESGHDQIDVVGCLVLISLSKINASSINDIKENIKTSIDLEIPNDVLQTAVKRLRKKALAQYTELKNHTIASITTTEKGNDLKLKVESDFAEAERNKNALLKNIQNFIQNTYQLLTTKDIEKALYEFINKNLILTNSNKVTKLDQQLADYFRQVESSDHDNYKRLTSLLYGKVVSLSLLKSNVEFGAKISDLVIYLDTNIVFSLFGFHEESYNEPVREILKVATDLGCVLKVFSSTKDEIASKLRGYLQDHGKYSAEVQVDSIYHILKLKKYSVADIISLIENIESKLNEYGIKIDYSFSFEKLIEESREEYISKLREVSPPFKHDLSVVHDGAALLAIKKLRGGNKMTLDKSKFIFLTADFLLTRFNFDWFKHKDNKTFPEAIYRSDLASMFWLKGQRGGENAFFHDFLANYSRTQSIKNDTWLKFIGKLEDYKQRGKITDEEISTIISFHETEKILRGNPQSGAEIVISDANLKKIKNNTIKKDATLQAQEQELKKRFGQFEKISKAIQDQCEKKWNFIRILLIWGFGVLVIGSIGYFIYQNGFDNYKKWYEIIGSLLLVAVILGFCISLTMRKRFDFLNWFINTVDTFISRRTEKCIEKRKREINYSDD